MAVLTRASPFDTPASLVRKKLHPIDLSQNVACAWGRLFESFAREYIEWKHNTKVFGHTISLNLAKTHPLYGKVTCSPDGSSCQKEVSGTPSKVPKSSCQNQQVKISSDEFEGEKKGNFETFWNFLELLRVSQKLLFDNYYAKISTRLFLEK